MYWTVGSSIYTNLIINSHLDSTRHLYQKKLAILIRGDDTASSPSSADQTDSNGHDYDETTNGLNGSTTTAATAPDATPAAKNGLDQYSADEDTEDGEDEAQPEAVVRKTPTKSSSKRSSASSKKAQSLADKASELRQRFAGELMCNSGDDVTPFIEAWFP